MGASAVPPHTRQTLVCFITSGPKPKRFIPSRRSACILSVIELTPFVKQLCPTLGAETLR